MHKWADSRSVHMFVKEHLHMWVGKARVAFMLLHFPASCASMPFQECLKRAIIVGNHKRLNMATKVRRADFEIAYC